MTKHLQKVRRISRPLFFSPKTLQGPVALTGHAMKHSMIFLSSILLIAACTSQPGQALRHRVNNETEGHTFRRTVYEWGSPLRISVTERETVFRATWPAKDQQGRLPVSGLQDEDGEEITLVFEKDTGVLVDW
jgi:hypothetical protein